jgi:hypothetical protein
MTRLALLCHIIAKSSQSGNAVIPLLNFTHKPVNIYAIYSDILAQRMMMVFRSTRTKSDGQRRCFLGRL